tara:strand:- start:124 stop:240 length:117 start_codon:yes stop_codon:yes gene_type:complete
MKTDFLIIGMRFYDAVIDGSISIFLNKKVLKISIKKLR